MRSRGNGQILDIANAEIEALGTDRREHVRRFARQFEEYARKAPFAVRIDVVAGVKRYVREGNSQ